MVWFWQTRQRSCSVSVRTRAISALSPGPAERGKSLAATPASAGLAALVGLRSVLIGVARFRGWPPAMGQHVGQKMRHRSGPHDGT